MLSAVRSRTVDAAFAAVWLRRLAAVLAVVAAAFAVRGPACVDGMQTGVPPTLGSAAIPMGMDGAATPAAVMTGHNPDADAGAASAEAAMPPRWCSAMAWADFAGTDPGSCWQTSQAANVVGAVVVAIAEQAGYAVALPSAAPAVRITAVLRYAATLDQLCLLRT